MHLPSALLLLGSTAALAAPNFVRRQDTAIIENGSFESGVSGWTLTGGASVVSNNDTNPWNFAATDGSNFAILQSSNANTTSSISTSISGLDLQQWTFSFDWNYMAIVSSRGPPAITCTLQTSFFDGFIAQSWTRRASLGGAGHVEETLDTNFGGATMTIGFECVGEATSTVTYNIGVAIDNVKWTAA